MRGAIATTDLIQGKDYPDRVGRMIDLFSKYIGRDVHIDNQVFMSERTTGHRNRAIGYLMRNFEMVNKDFEESLELYFQQCSILVNAHDLAVMGATLANSGVNPLTNQRAISAEYVKDVLSIMLTCGMYDYAGEWAYRVGLPAKSGVAAELSRWFLDDWESESTLLDWIPKETAYEASRPVRDYPTNSRSMRLNVRKTAIKSATKSDKLGLLASSARTED